MNSLFRPVRLILRHDLRLLWRDVMSTSWRDYLSVGLVVVVFVIANAIAIPLFFVFRQRPPLGAETLVWLFFAFLMLGTAMNHAIKLLFERSDFDLLLSAPISARAILLARIAAISAGAALSVALFLLPLLDGALLALSPGYACGYLVWLLLSGAVASAGVWSTLLLVQWLGPRRARTWAQVAAAVLGAGVFLVTQAQNLLPPNDHGAFLHRVLDFVAQPWIAFLARAGRGELPPLLALIAITALFTTLTTRLLGRIFIDGVQAGNAIVSPRKSAPTRARPFVGGVARATFWKDIRLIRRDPLLLAQVLPTALYLLPALLGVRRFGDPAALLGAAALVLATQFSIALTAVCASGEECWDLIRMSPTPELRLRLAKMAAGTALPALLCVGLCLAQVILGHPLLALLALVFSLGCAAAGAWLQVAHIKPTPRRDVMRRGRNSGQSMGQTIAMTLLTLLGAAGLGFAGSEHWVVATILLSVEALGIVGCFTLVHVEEISSRDFAAPETPT